MSFSVSHAHIPLLQHLERVLLLLDVLGRPSLPQLAVDQALFGFWVVGALSTTKVRGVKPSIGGGDNERGEKGEKHGLTSGATVSRVRLDERARPHLAIPYPSRASGHNEDGTTSANHGKEHVGYRGKLARGECRAKIAER